MTVARNTGCQKNPFRGDLARANSCAAVPRGKSLAHFPPGVCVRPLQQLVHDSFRALVRFARRFAWPTLLFNAHSQFDWLREEGGYVRVQEAIRRRERDLQGTLNPNLAEFGTSSEARQYSGRRAEPEWRCPFHTSEASGQDDPGAVPRAAEDREEDEWTG